MDVANWLVKLYLSEHFLQTAFISITFSACVAHFLDRSMEGRSPGVAVITIIILGAIALAASVEDRRIAMLLPDDALRISTMACGIACGLLLMTASLRQWLRGHL